MKTVKLSDVNVYNLEFSIRKDNLCHIVVAENNRRASNHH